ncbi:hemolysin secretion protein D [Pseudolabrys sp. Root1462]|jgi:HlyD family secretion protein|uniref:HlyD family type I secretion periplasmic adaptor subunit n=1 Tax=Pseudolabrys sp. Root1462 TaxID=1736466 RepID=UPI000702EDA9|nr:HlyD family type I secretion periplasmic adaptor subunit [Pseudolabrys sp. Root1462]KQZ02301.1 hemolysin secretion protein D [Pseudolabrys sp. Root1462]
MNADRGPSSSAQASIRRHLIVGLMIVLFLGGGVGGWAATVKLAGALIAQGSIVVDQNVQKVQHPTGGIVGDLRVHDGDYVKSGDVLVRLDETVMRANLAIVTKGLDQAVARKARLEAERDGADTIAFPADLMRRATDADVADTMASERKLFELRRAERLGQKAQLTQRVKQLEEEIGGIEAQQAAKSQEIDLISRELEGVRDLYKRNLVQLTRLTQLERETARLGGERAQLVATAAQSKGKISEIRLQIIQIDQNLSSDVAKELRETDSKIGEFVERKITAEDQLRRTDIRAPQTGFVFQSAVHTVGGVITAGDPIMYIVPDSAKLQVEAKVQPQDIAQVKVGQAAVLRFSAFDARTTPEINGEVTRVSADTSTDQRTGASYYTIRISLPAEALQKLDDLKLLPGMPVEAFVQTGERTVISYLMKPLQDQFMRAFREK